MANWYFKNSINLIFMNVGNWWSNPDGTGVHPASYPWSDATTQDDNLLPATGFTNFALYNPNAYDADPPIGLGEGLTITGTCSVKIDLLGGGEEASYGAIASGNYSAAISGSFGSALNNPNKSGFITGGTFSGAILVGAISGGTFNNTTTCGAVTAGTFNSTLTANSITGGIVSATGGLTGVIGAITGGTFACPITVSANVSGGTFNNTFNKTGSTTVSGTATFNGSFTQTAGNVTGGVFNGTYTRVSGNVTGGTFNNGILNQFYRNGFPPPLIFTGYNPNALDVLGTGLG